VVRGAADVDAAGASLHGLEAAQTGHTAVCR